MVDPRLLDRLLAQVEREWVEFKQSWFEPNRVGHYLSALANGARLAGRPHGYLVWGVANDRSVVGTTVNLASRNVGNQPFEFWLKGRLSPKGHGVRIIDLERDGLRVSMFEVDAADKVPVRFDGIAYIRVGSATPRLEDHPDRERRLMELLVSSSFEMDVAREHATAEEVFELLDVPAALSLLKQPPTTDPVAQLEQLEKFQLLKSNGGNAWTLTNRAAILFARQLADFGEQFERRAPRIIFYNADNRAHPRREQTGAMGYALGFEGLFAWLDMHLPRSEELRGVLREDRPQYPIEALRELVANALIHQDFAIRGAGPMIEVFDGRIEIGNPGAPLIEVDRLMDEPPRSRNERLAFLMRRMGYCEERGSGIDKVILGAEAYQLPAPAFEAKQHGFVATMFAPRPFADMTAEERIRACYQHACLLWVTGNRSMTNSTLRQRFGLADDRASRISHLIGEALEAGLIKPTDPLNRSRAQASYRPYWA